jgi:hypothetical protein
MSVRALTLLCFHVMVLPAGTGSLALGAGEVEGLLQDDNTSGRITKVRDQLGVGLGMYCQQSSSSQYWRSSYLGINRRCASATSYALGEPFSCTSDTNGRNVRSPDRERSSENRKLHDGSSVCKSWILTRDEDTDGC